MTEVALRVFTHPAGPLRPNHPEHVPSFMQQTSILTAIREATADAHQRLEDTIQISSQLADAPSYRKLLERFYGFFAPMERNLLRVQHLWPDEYHYPDLSRTRWLTADLHALQASPEGLPCCLSVPIPNTSGEAFGCAYVLEGSALGGRHILGLLREKPFARAATQFFSSYGDKVGDHWKSFCGVLNAHHLDEQICPAAVATFAAMQRWWTEHEY